MTPRVGGSNTLIRRGLQCDVSDRLVGERDEGERDCCRATHVPWTFVGMWTGSTAQYEAQHKAEKKDRKRDRDDFEEGHV